MHMGVTSEAETNDKVQHLGNHFVNEFKLVLTFKVIVRPVCVILGNT